MAPAKLNLFLEVLSRRDDGFHEIETLMTAVSLFDSLYFFPQKQVAIELECHWAAGLGAQAVAGSHAKREQSLGDLPEGADNLATRAVQLLAQRAGVRQGARLRLIKRIPSQAGLGGASSDAAAALWAANLGWQLGWPRGRLRELAAELGSDLPFFLGSGSALCRGRGEQITPLHSAGSWHLVVVRPPVGLSTALVYRNCRPADRPQDSRPLLEALARGDLAQAARKMVNRLEEPAGRLCPWIGRLRQEMERLDCVGHQMSGSGTGYFGICRHARHAEVAARRLRARGVGQVWPVCTLSFPSAADE